MLPCSLGEKAETPPTTPNGLAKGLPLTEVMHWPMLATPGSLAVRQGELDWLLSL